MVKPLKVGLIGAGRIANRHLAAYNNFSEKVKLVAVCDIVSDSAQEYAKKAHVENVYTDPVKMLKEADIDAVDICASHDKNAYLAVLAAESGRHVLVEKPMGISIQQCREVLKATDKAGVTFMVAQMLRYVPNNRTVYNFIKEGKLGSIRAVHSEAMANGISLMSSGSWYSDYKKSGGGVVISVGIHNIDLLRYFFGDIKSAFAMLTNKHPAFPPGIEDHASIILTFESGAVAELFADYATRRVPWVWQYLVLGTEGTVVSSLPFREQFGQQRWDTRIAFTKMDKEALGAGTATEEFIPIKQLTYEGFENVDPFTNEILHFANCCQLKMESISSGKDNLGTMKAIFAIYESAKSGKNIDLATL